MRGACENPRRLLHDSRRHPQCSCDNSDLQTDVAAADDDEVAETVECTLEVFGVSEAAQTVHIRLVGARQRTASRGAAGSKDQPVVPDPVAVGALDSLPTSPVIVRMWVRFSSSGGMSGALPMT